MDEPSRTELAKVIWSLRNNDQIHEVVKGIFSLGEGIPETMAVTLINACETWQMRSLPACTQIKIFWHASKMARRVVDQKKVGQLLVGSYCTQWRSLGNLLPLFEGTYRFGGECVIDMVNCMFAAHGCSLAEVLPICDRDQFREFVRVAGQEEAAHFVREFVERLPRKIEDVGTSQNARDGIFILLEFLAGIPAESSIGIPMLNWIGMAVDRLVAWHHLIDDWNLVLNLKKCTVIDDSTRAKMRPRLTLALACLRHTNEAPTLRKAICALIGEEDN
jgi:hypothetical protein